jgi:hypothetical protein
MEMQETPNGSVLKNKNKVGRFPLTELKTNSKETVIKTMWSGIRVQTQRLME